MIRNYSSRLAGGPWTLDSLADTFPWIDWTTPRRIALPGVGATYVCRICLANDGADALQLALDPKTYAQINEHIAKEHVSDRTSEIG